LDTSKGRRGRGGRGRRGVRWTGRQTVIASWDQVSQVGCVTLSFQLVASRSRRAATTDELVELPEVPSRRGLEGEYVGEWV
jgi:hypothetical protein